MKKEAMKFRGKDLRRILWMTSPELFLVLACIGNMVTIEKRITQTMVIDLLMQLLVWILEISLFICKDSPFWDYMHIVRILVGVSGSYILEELLILPTYVPGDQQVLANIVNSRFRKGMVATEKVAFMRSFVTAFEYGPTRTRGYFFIGLPLKVAVQSYVLCRAGMEFSTSVASFFASISIEYVLLCQCFGIMDFVATRTVSLLMSDSINHSLKNAFASIGSRSQLLADNITSDIQREDLLEEARQITLSADYGIVMCNSRGAIDQAKDTKRGGKANLSCKALGEMMQTFSRRIVVEGSPRDLYIHSNKLDTLIALENMISNARSHGDRTRGISLTMYRGGDSIIIQVANCVSPGGEGFQEHSFGVQSRLFDLSHSPIRQPSDSIFLSRPPERGLFDQKHMSQGKGMGILKSVVKRRGYGLELTQQGPLVFTRLALPLLHKPRPENDTAMRAVEANDEGKKLRVCLIDDMPMLRKIYKRMILNYFDQNHSIVLGDKPEQVCKAAHLIYFENYDCCVIDQNLEYGQRLVKGTDIIREARMLGYTGLMFIRSANCSSEDREFYLRCGADDAMGKGTKPRDIHSRVSDLLRERRRTEVNTADNKSNSSTFEEKKDSAEMCGRKRIRFISSDTQQQSNKKRHKGGTESKSSSG